MRCFRPCGWAALSLLLCCSSLTAAAAGLCPAQEAAPYGIDPTDCIANLPPYIGLSWGAVCALTSLLVEWRMFSQLEIGQYSRRAVLSQWLRGAGLAMVVFLTFIAYFEMVAFQSALRPVINDIDDLYHSTGPSIRAFVLLTLIHTPALIVFLATKYLTFVHGFGKSVRKRVLWIEVTATLAGALVASAVASLTSWR